ncbi:putative ABC transporter-binding protein precursor [Peptococcaceae bacterium CEB3]|nr:putative ABC transporter-binding protein precursor [Peptococcaceae bacterium CEB3]
MRKRKVITLVTALSALLFLVAAGCGTSNTSATNETTSASGPFSWTSAKGQTINVLLEKHPWMTPAIQHISQFEKLTGITVKYTEAPESSYFDKVSTVLSARNGSTDVIMTGAYQAWQYGSAGYFQDLNSFVNNPSLTSPDFDISDFLPTALGDSKWDLKPGDPVGTGELLAIPVGMDTDPLSYNVQAFKKAGITSPPKTLRELYQDAVKLKDWNGPGSYGLVVRGARSWDAVVTGDIASFTAAGGKDFNVENGKLKSGFGSPQAVEWARQWSAILRDGGAPGWANYQNWQTLSDFGAGKAAMMWDDDTGVFWENLPGASAEAGKLAVAMPPAGPDGQIASDQWLWSLAMNKYSKHKTAAWLFIQWATGKQLMAWGALHGYLIDPVRASVWNNPDFINYVKTKGPKGYYDTVKALYPHAKMNFTPQPYFFQTATDWAVAIQNMVNGQASPSQGMKALAQQVDNLVKDVSVK